MSKFEFENVYKVKTVEDYIRYAKRDIERCEEAISKQQEYVRKMEEHIKEIENTEFENEVLLNRTRDYSTNRVEFYISLAKKPVIDKKHRNGATIYGEFSHDKKFEGKERHLALAYASKLGREFNCPVIKKGFKN